MRKNSLAYSTLTDTVYWIDGKGGRHECTQNFIQVMLLWLLEGDGIPEFGQKYMRELNGDKHHWQIIYQLLDNVAPNTETTTT